MTPRSLVPWAFCALALLFGGPAATPVLAQVAPAAARAAVPSPEDVLGYPIGGRFTDHAGVVRYMEAVAAAAPGMTRLERYGESAEGRVLVQLIVARPDHLGRLEELLALNRELTQPGTSESRAREIAASNPAVLYFSYGVHGNESSSSEAALWTTWDLLRGSPEVAGVLDNAIVIIDPVANPDGRDRYVNFYRQARGARPNPNPNSREHWEPWPGGRPNHYLFDLNRDWAWATQPETRARLATWQRFSPQVHVDFHEMGFESSYFFFPATPPVNPIYPQHITRWGRVFGEANAAAFDTHGWAYWTGESFDLFYPGYGDSWPSLLGAIGMTYEQAGSGRGGQAVVRSDGDTLTLAQRATQHRTTGNATLRAAATGKAQLLNDFALSHRTVDQGLPDILIVPGNSGRAAALLELLERQSIEVERAGQPFRTTATAHPGFETRREFPAGTFRVRARQPRGRLAITLLQAETVLDATFSYDVSSWSLPYAYGVEAHSVRNVPNAGWTRVSGNYAVEAAAAARIEPMQTYGYIVAPGFDRWPALVRYMRAGGTVRAIARPFTIEGRDWPAGTLFLPRGAAAPDMIARRINESGLAAFVVPARSGLSSRGPDLATDNAVALRLPRVAVLTETGVSSTSFGSHWFFLEQTLGLDFDAVPTDRFAGININDYDVIIAPDMGRGPFGDPAIERLRGWVQNGGTLIASSGGARTIGMAVAEIKASEAAADADSVKLRRALAGREARRIERFEDNVPGTILAVNLDPDHPLAAGAGLDHDPSRLFVLHSGGLAFAPEERFETVAHFDASAERVSGVISTRNLGRLGNSSWLAMRRIGGGKVILFGDDPTFRHFWYGAWQPFANAVLVGPGM
jgi:hypothetical protein